MQSFPLHSPVDVLIIGATSAAVSAALRVRSAGCTVLVVSDRSYFGEETAGRFILNDEGLNREVSLVQKVFPETGRRRLPGAIKRALEMELLNAGVKFLYLARPVAVLRGNDGTVAGAIIAHRSSPFAIRCRAVIDATSQGVVARLGGVGLKSNRPLPEYLDWRMICRNIPEDWSGLLQEVGDPFPGGEKQDGPSCPFVSLRVPVAGDYSDAVTWEHVVRSRWVQGGLDVTADVLDLPSREVVDAPLVSRWEDVGESALNPVPGLWLASGVLPLDADGVSALSRLDVAAELGSKVADGVLRDLENGEQTTSALHAMAGGAVAGEYRFSEAFLRDSAGRLELPDLIFPSLGAVDVAVAGGGTGGAGAGISAARAGARTVVLEMQHGLGGVGTLGLISSYYFGNRVGFTAELTRELAALGNERDVNWYPEVKMALYHRLLREAGGTAWLGAFAFGVRREGDAVNGLLVSTAWGCGILETGCVIDATGSADVAAAAGAPCRVVNARHAAVQGTGLSPRFAGVRYYNSDHTFIDDNDCEGVTHAFVNARAKFSKAFDTSPLVDSRERRQIVGDIELSPLDMLAGRTFPDTMVTAMSNFDTHGFTVHPLFAVLPPDKKAMYAHVPFRCMLPQGLERVLVTGLGMSAHRDALPVIRMQPDVQNQGYAAGLAAAASALQEKNLRELDLRAIQARLVEKEILAAEVVSHEDSFPLADKVVDEAVSAGLANHMHGAVLFAQAEKSVPRLLALLGSDAEADRKLDAALILGMLGYAEAAPFLADHVKNNGWDKGWNYTGMHQFGFSQSRMDAAIVALATTGCDSTGEIVAGLAAELDASAEFSHCRAIAVAAMRKPSQELSAALARLLRLPGMTGHAQVDSLGIVQAANGDTIETEARNLSLREIYLARGLFWSGDEGGLGRSILENYTRDLRGLFARHAHSVLESDAKEWRRESPLEWAV